MPDIQHVELDLDLFPAKYRYHAKGKYSLKNPGEKPLDEILLTGGFHWKKLSWTMDGKPAVPSDRAGLYVFQSAGRSYRTGQMVEVGFEHEGTYPQGTGEQEHYGEFIVPSSVVLTSFRPSIAPILGFRRGNDDENRQDPKEFRDDFYEGQTDSFVGARAPAPTKITVTAPADFTVNSVGTKPRP